MHVLLLCTREQAYGNQDQVQQVDVFQLGLL